jgi:hypothetical protein
MEGRFFAILGKIAGIGGLALGVFLLIFRGVLTQNLLFSAGLSQDAAFYIIAGLLLLTFGIAGIGIVAWLISRDQVIHPGSILLLALLIILLFGGTIYLFSLGAREKLSGPTSASSPAPALPSKPVPKETRVCFGNGGGNNCISGAQAHYDCDFYGKVGGGGDRTTQWLGEQFCTTIENGQKKVMPFTVGVYQNNSGGQCGWTGFTVTCNP